MCFCKKIILNMNIVSITLSLLSLFLFFSADSREENLLFGKIIYVDAGHGGKDNGAFSGNVLEDEINLKISNKLIELLLNKGAYVLSTRSGDYDLSSIYSKNKKREDLKNRVKYINESKVDIFVSIHLNTYPSSNVYGAQVFQQITEKSNKLAKCIQSNLNDLTGKYKEVKFGDYYILNKTNRTGVIVECGFLTNDQEKEKLLKDDYQSKIANKIAKGIIQYFTEV